MAARTVRQLIADGERNAAQYDKQIADHRANLAFQDACMAERWENTIGRGFPYFDHRRRGMWFPSNRHQQPPRGEIGEGT